MHFLSALVDSHVLPQKLAALSAQIAFDVPRAAQVLQRGERREHRRARHHHELSRPSCEWPASPKGRFDFCISCHDFLTSTQLGLAAAVGPCKVGKTVKG